MPTKLKVTDVGVTIFTIFVKDKLICVGQLSTNKAFEDVMTIASSGAIHSVPSREAVYSV